MKTLNIKVNWIAIIFLLSICLYPISGFTYSQENAQIPVNPSMKVSNLNKTAENPMRLDLLKVDIKVIGQIAVTTLDMTFYNPNSRVMEGEFNFPLGDGQTVSRFALDINGTMREGVVVEKEQGRKTFEAIVRRGVDPGLLEMTAGNNFRMRVYPLPAKGIRRVILAFEQELTNKGASDLYLLPLKMSEPVAKFSVHVEVVKKQVEFDKEQNELSNISFNKWNESYVAGFEQNNFTPDKQIALSFPHLNDNEKVYTAIKNSTTDSSYFYINLRPRLFEEAKVLPKRITLLWDNSNSAKDRNIEKELELLDSYIHKIGSLNIELIPFNIKLGKSEAFEIINANWNKLKSALETMTYDGGTSLGCLNLTKFKSDEILLFSDGISTFGNSEPEFSTIPINTINSSVTSNPSYLNYIAQRSGGVYINLNKLSDDEAVAMLKNNNYHFISAQIDKGNVTSVYPSMPCQFHNTFSLVGTMVGKSATVTLNFGFGSTVKYSKTIEIGVNNDVADYSILSRLWSEKKIAELSLNEEKNKKEISLIGKEFGVVTPNTSLIVLENLSDYLENNIVPPIEMQEAYFANKNETEKNIEQEIQNHINYVVDLSKKQTKWWNTIYPIISRTTVKGKTQTGTRFTAPVIRRDEEVRSQEQLNVAGTISIADVKGNDELNGRDIADIKEAGYDRKNRGDIEINAWDPQTPYLKVLQYTTVGEEYQTYLKLKKEYGLTPSFYMDASDFFSKSGRKDTAVLILSNLAELQLESPELLRVLGKKLIDLKQYPEAISVFQKVLKLKAEEPQSYRDLGLAYEGNGNYQQAINTLYEVIKKQWDLRFPGIELIVMNEINSIIFNHRGLDYSFIDKRLIKSESVDVRVILTWDTDNCDMDLWVTDPAGEKCFYGNKITGLGGKISDDFTGGYGPEEFMIKNAMDGKYSVQANYFGTRSQTRLAPVNLHLVFVTNFGKPNQKKREVSIRLDNKQDVIDVGKFSFTTPKNPAK